MFQFTGFAVLADLKGFPIRTPVDQRPFAPTHSFSQLTASFFASVCLGIHRAPYLAFSLTPAWGVRGKALPNARIQFLLPGRASLHNRFLPSPYVK